MKQGREKNGEAWREGGKGSDEAVLRETEQRKQCGKGLRESGKNM